MQKLPVYEWNEEKGEAIVYVYDRNKVYSGIAYCHPDDKDMKSQKTGLKIAEMRATINAWKGYKDEIKTGLAVLNQLYYSMKHSKRYNPKSYEAVMLQRQISNKKIDLVTVQIKIEDTTKMLKDYLADKEWFYQQIRKNRMKDKEN